MGTIYYYITSILFLGLAFGLYLSGLSDTLLVAFSCYSSQFGHCEITPMSIGILLIPLFIISFDKKSVKNRWLKNAICEVSFFLQQNFFIFRYCNIFCALHFFREEENK